MSFCAGKRIKLSGGVILEPGDPVPGAENWEPRIIGEKLHAGILVLSKDAAPKKTEAQEETEEPKKTKKKTKKKS